MERQYVAVKIGTGGGRSYTYHNDGAPLAVGDEVEVYIGKPNSRGYRKKAKLKIVSLVAEKPSFPTKPVGIPTDFSEPLVEA